jgi:hypothetical protein
MFLCSDTDFCETRRRAGQQAAASAQPVDSKETRRG